MDKKEYEPDSKPFLNKKGFEEDLRPMVLNPDICKFNLKIN